MTETTGGLSAEIVTTGTEILLGEIVDTNSAWMARELTGVGVNLFYVVSVGDNQLRIQQAIEDGLKRSDVVLVTGGLGPTVDDVTRQAVAAATGRKLILHDASLAKLRERFSRWGKEMTANNEQQALIPEGADLIENPVGTAPGFLVDTGDGIVMTLPGVPREMKCLMTEFVLPYLRERTGGQGVIQRRVLRTVGLGESNIDSQIADLMENANPSVGLAAHTGQTDVRLTVRASSLSEATEILNRLETEIRGRIGDFIYSDVPEETVESAVAKLCRQLECRIRILETNSRGKIAARLQDALAGFDPIGTSFVDTGTPTPEMPLTFSRTSVTASDALSALQFLGTSSGEELLVAVIGTQGSDEGVYGKRSGQTWLAFKAQGIESTFEFPYGGADELTLVWLGNRVLDLLRRSLLSGG